MHFFVRNASTDKEKFFLYFSFLRFVKELKSPLTPCEDKPQHGVCPAEILIPLLNTNENSQKKLPFISACFADKKMQMSFLQYTTLTRNAPKRMSQDFIRQQKRTKHS